MRHELAGRGSPPATPYARRVALFVTLSLAAVLAVLVTVWARYPLRASCRQRLPLTRVLPRALPPIDFLAPQINQYQVVGTHNSYHQRSWLPVPPWQYSHPAIADQLDQGARTIEVCRRIAPRSTC
jgi:hypothetical protein